MGRGGMNTEALLAHSSLTRNIVAALFMNRVAAAAAAAAAIWTA